MSSVLGRFLEVPLDLEEPLFLFSSFFELLLMVGAGVVSVVMMRAASGAVSTSASGGVVSRRGQCWKTVLTRVGENLSQLVSLLILFQRLPCML